MQDFKIGQEVSYKDVPSGEVVTGIIVSIVQIIDHEEKELIGKKVSYIERDCTCYPDEVLTEYLKPIEDKHDSAELIEGDKS